MSSYFDIWIWDCCWGGEATWVISWRREGSYVRSKDGTATNRCLLFPIVHLVVFLVGLHVVHVWQLKPTLHFVPKGNFMSLCLFINVRSWCVPPFKCQFYKTLLRLPPYYALAYLPATCCFLKAEFFKMDVSGLPVLRITVFELLSVSQAQRVSQSARGGINYHLRLFSVPLPAA